MSGQNKELKITWGMDQSSHQRAMRMTSDVLSQLQKIIETSQRAGQAMGGMLGGGAMTARNSGPGSGLSTIMSPGGSAPRMNLAAGAPDLSKNIQAYRDMFKGLADVSKGSFNVINDALRDSARKQVRELEDIETAIKNLTKAYGDLDNSASSDKKKAHYQGLLMNYQARKASGEANMRDLNAQDMGLMGGGGQAGGGGFWNKMKSWGGKNIPGTSVLGAMGFPLGAAAAFAVGTQITPTFKDSYSANAKYQLDKPMFQYELMSRFGDYNVKAQQLRYGGKASEARAWRTAMDTVAKQELASKYYAGKADLDTLQTGRDENGNLRTGAFGDVGLLLRTAKQKAGQWGSEGQFTEDQIARSRFDVTRTAEGVERVRTVAEAEMKKEAHYNALLDDVQGGAYGAAGIARSAGIGLGIGQHKIDGRWTTMSAGKALETRAQKRLMSASELAGYRAQFMSVDPTVRGKGEGYAGAMIGGLSNVAELYGVGSQFGSGDKFVGGVQGSIGRGGVGIGAGRQLAQTATGYMTSGNFEGSGVDAVQGLMSSAFTGDVGTDLRMSRVMASGMAQYQSYAGGADGLTKALNVVYSARALPGSYAGQRILREIASNPMMMTQILRDKNVPERLRRAGITYEAVKNYRDQQTRGSMMQFIGAAAGDSKMAQTARAFLSSGKSVEGFVRERLGSVSAGSKAGRGTIRQIVGDLATAKMAAEGGTLESNEGYFETILAGDKGIRAGLKGKGAHDIAIKGTAQGEVGAADSDVTRRQGFEEAKADGKIKDDVKKRAGTADALEGIATGGILGKTAEALEMAMKRFIGALDQGTGALKSRAPGG